MNRIRKRILILTCVALAALCFLIIIPAFAVGGDYGIETGSTPGGPTPFLSVYPSTDTPEPPTATPTG